MAALNWKIIAIVLAVLALVAGVVTLLSSRSAEPVAVPAAADDDLSRPLPGPNEATRGEFKPSPEGRYRYTAPPQRGADGGEFKPSTGGSYRYRAPAGTEQQK